MPLPNLPKWDRSRFLLRLIFIVAASLIFFLMGLTYKHLQQVSENNYWVTHSMEISLRMERLYADLKDIETERRNFLLTRDPDTKRLVKNRIVEIDGIMKNLSQSFRDNSAQKKNLKALQDLISLKYQVVNDSFTDNVSTDPQKIRENLLAGRHIMSGITEQINTMMTMEEKLLDKRRQDFQMSEEITPVYLYVISLFSLGLLGFTFYRINKDASLQHSINKSLNIALDSSGLAENVASFGIFIMEINGSHNSFSDNLYRILGYEPDAFPPDYAHYSRHIHPEDLPLVNEKRSEILLGKDDQPFQYRIIRRDGTEGIFEETSKKIKDRAGSDIILTVIRDVTEDIRNKKSLQIINRELSFYNTLSKEAENIGKYGFWRWDVAHNTFAFSDNVHKILGLPEDFEASQIFGANDIVHPDDVEAARENFEKFRNREQFIPPITFRIKKRNDGSIRHLRISNKMMNPGTAEEYYLMITQDISEEISDKILIEEKNRTLQAQNRELTAFNYAASHDLQEPLRKIETFISRLQEKDYHNLSENGKLYLDRTAASAGRMRTLIHDLLQFSRTSRTDQVFELADLNQIFQHVREDFQQILDDRQATIVADPLPTLSVIPFQIRQLFQNIISNALKYSMANRPPIIKISCSTVSAKDEPVLMNIGRGRFCRIDFQDNGIGFASEYSEKIFELFNRLHSRSEYEGTGIGLAICKKIAENHNGYLYAEGAPGAGATFHLYLPAEI